MHEAEVHVRGIGLHVYKKDKMYRVKEVTRFRYFGQFVLVIGDIEFDNIYKRTWVIFKYAKKDKEKLDVFFKNEITY